MTVKKWINKRITLAVCFALIGAICLFGVNWYVKGNTKEQIITAESASTLSQVDCILILGCGVQADGSPTLMLQERLSCGTALYQNKVAPKLLLSGDHGTTEYNEVATMKNYALEKGIPSADIFLDHAGFSTYDSLYRAKVIFGAKRIVIVTQEYHLYRALYIANRLGLEAYGVSCDIQTYAGQFFRNVREIVARNKDWVKCIFKPQPTFLGDAIPISGNGELTH